MKTTIFQVKLVHTLVFWLLSACVVYLLFSAVADRLTTWTWVAAGLLAAESIVLGLSGWTCPLTIMAERLGAERGSVTDLFLPKWCADRIFPVCGTMFMVSLAIIAVRLVS